MIQHVPQIVKRPELFCQVTRSGYQFAYFLTQGHGVGLHALMIRLLLPVGRSLIDPSSVQFPPNVVAPKR